MLWSAFWFKNADTLRIPLKREICDIIPIFDDITTFLWH